jgi:hypothetical protein
VPDALFVPDAGGRRVDIVKLRAPARLDLEEIVTATATGAVRWLERRGYLRHDADGSIPADADSSRMRCLRGSLGTADLQRGTEHDDERRAERRSSARSSKGLGTHYLRFNLHAGVSVPSGLPAACERLVRYCVIARDPRSPKSASRCSMTAGSVIESKTPIGCGS